MKTISITYTMEWQLSFSSNHVWTKCGMCFNSKTDKRLKQCYKNGVIGYYVNSKFYSLKFLRTKLELITKVDCPF